MLSACGCVTVTFFSFGVSRLQLLLPLPADFRYGGQPLETAGSKQGSCSLVSAPPARSSVAIRPQSLAESDLRLNFWRTCTAPRSARYSSSRNAILLYKSAEDRTMPSKQQAHVSGLYLLQLHRRLLSLSAPQGSSDGLIKAVRSLDQDSAESIPDTLSNLWSLLSNSISGPFHASEDLILRWLLKNMNGSAENAERFRRYPMAWRIMASVFRRIPLISLAKSLADRRFIPILQQTLKDISSRQTEALGASDASPDVEMVDAGSAVLAKKRKRSHETQFDLAKLRSSQGSLGAAEALLDALRTLIERLEPVLQTTSDGDAPSSVHMGVEHVKSLFCSPAKDAIELLRPILSICDMSMQEHDSGPFENQAAWISTFATLWNLHLQSSSDAHEVAVSLYPIGCIALARMDRSKDLVLDPLVKATWTRDLRRFFIKNMILPAKAAFLNRKNIEIIQAAADVTNFMPTASYPILFSLAVKTPHSTKDAGARKDHEDWTQTVFEIIEEPMRGADPTKRNQAMKIVLDTALESKASISLAGLRTVCRQYTLATGNMDLHLITRAVSLDVDAFLLSNEGHSLLDDILKQVTDLRNTELARLADEDPVNLIVALANGFAMGRDLSGFIKKWFQVLAACFKRGTESSAITTALSSHEIVDTVSSLLHSSINTKQLLSLLDWFESQETATNPEAFLVVLDAISKGVTEEESADAVNLRVYEMISKLKLKVLGDPMKARWWRIVEDTVSRAIVEQAGVIWTKVDSHLKKALKEADLDDLATSAAFRCSSQFWLTNYPGGPHESEAAAMTCSLLKRLEKHMQQIADHKESGSLNLLGTPRLVNLLVNSDSHKERLEMLLRRADIVDVATSSFIRNEANVNNSKFINGLIGQAIDILAQEQKKPSGWNVERIVAATQILLEAPSETFTREQREQVMPKTLFFISNIQRQKLEHPVVLTKLLLGLMVKIMKRPTFYEGMEFDDLVTVGDSIVVILQDSFDVAPESAISPTYGTLKIFEGFVLAALSQMTSNLDKREHAYLTKALSTVSKWSHHSTESEPHRCIIAKSLILALESFKTKHQVRELADPAILRESVSLMLANCLTADRFRALSSHYDWLKGGLPFCFDHIVIEQLDVVQPSIVRDRICASRTDLEHFSEMLCTHGAKAGWRLKELIVLCCGNAIKEPLSISVNHVLRSSDREDSVPPCLRADASDVSRYIDVVLKSMDDERRNNYFVDICAKLRDTDDLTGPLLSLHRLIRAESGM